MAGPQNKYETLARDAAERIEAAREAGQQLTFLPDEPQPDETERAKRGKGKATTQLRDWLAARGYRLPEDVLSEMAGLRSGLDAVTEAIAKTERVLAAARGGSTAGGKPSLGQWLATFNMVYTAQLRAADALMPYGAPKASPDVNVSQAVFLVAGGNSQQPADRAQIARDVTPGARRIAPPPMPEEIQQNQRVAESEDPQSDSGSRTEGAKR